MCEDGVGIMLSLYDYAPTVYVYGVFTGFRGNRPLLFSTLPPPFPHLPAASFIFVMVMYYAY